MKVTNKPFCPLERNFLVCLLISFLALVIVSCRAKGEKSISLSLQSPWKSFSASPLIVRSTNAFALRRWVLNSPLMDVTNPSPAPSLGRLGQDGGYWSDFPAWPSLSLKIRSISGTPAPVGLLNFRPYIIHIKDTHLKDLAEQLKLPPNRPMLSIQCFSWLLKAILKEIGKTISLNFFFCQFTVTACLFYNIHINLQW